jgi:hypothetical protein
MLHRSRLYGSCLIISGCAMVGLALASATQVVLADGDISQKCCIQCYVKLPSVPPGSSCTGPAGGPCTDTNPPPNTRSTAVDGACSGNNTTMNCTSNSLQPGQCQCTTWSYSFSCGPTGQGGACQYTISQVAGTNAIVNATFCAGDLCP